MKAWLAWAAATALVLVPVGPAGAGGACRGYEGERDAAGNSVSMRSNCFGPTVVRVERGQTVRFVNKDPVPHGVGGTAGSFGDMDKSIGPGESAAYTFRRDGVFPYVCIFHPGMAGVVVVGDGLGSSAGKSAATPASAAVSAGDPPQVNRGGPTTSAFVPAGLAVVAASALTAALLQWRRKRPRSAE